LRDCLAVGGVTVVLCAAAACGDGGGSPTADARGGTVDAPVADAQSPTVDAPPPGTDASSAPDAQGPIDSGGPGGADGSPAGPGIDCGGVSCGPTEICCIETDATGMARQLCTPSGACMGTPVMCDGPEDCAGTNVCCFTSAVSCVSEFVCGLVVCHDDTDCTSGMCCPSPIGAGPGVCCF
jgi:hypothetical protein